MRIYYAKCFTTREMRNSRSMTVKNCKAGKFEVSR
jgi:hypothetical protein